MTSVPAGPITDASSQWVNPVRSVRSSRASFPFP